MSFCSKCGYNLPDDAKFCPACGNPVNSQVSQNVNSAENQAQAQQPNFNQQASPNFNQQAQPNFNQQTNSNFNQQTQPNFNQQTNPNFNQQTNTNFNQQAHSNYNYQTNFNKNYTKNPDGTYVFTGPVNADGMYVSDVQKNKYLNILSYIGILFLIPLFAAKGSKYSRFHVNQGLILFIFEVAYNIIKAIVMAILSAIMFAGDYYYVLSPMYGLYSIINTILSIVNLGFTALAIYGIYNTCTGKVKELPIIGKFRILK